ncbi:hypothetical protein XF30_21060 [Bradyrhizobium sp. SUTN9-2]|uniref:DegT/DnrJ/EryC1/StrS family aminotransferase n=1 Tax=Bradyrhizobium sp. SUTN9-2 TaxID=1167456 RepID=UPI000D66A39A|nr:DegT/DnrJ/EryC1/StrS family aminotransferase [Bradyrhizobium sp. SUTN9-2]PWE78861.1 hypothetical protein XF30_21060 [Bradyrhizobium sp. SUTN9-2]
MGDQEFRALQSAYYDSLHIDRGFKAHEMVERFELGFREYVGAEHAIAVNGGGTGLDIALAIAEVGPDDEVISCAINFHGTHLAVLGRGSRLVLAEPEAPSLNISPTHLEALLTPRTRAVVVTHMNGHPAKIDAIEKVIHEYSDSQKTRPIISIYDACRACGAEYQSEKIGSRGSMTVFSFQSKKIITTLGEGGMIVTNDQAFARRAREIRSFGLGRAWGSNFKLTKIQAAVGQVQLGKLNALVNRRRQLALQRNSILGRCDALVLPTDGPNDRCSYNLYTLLLKGPKSPEARTYVMHALEELGIGCVVANEPTWKSNSYIANLVASRNNPVAEDIGSRIFCPSIHPLMTDDENAYIANAIAEACEKIEGRS